MKLPHVKLASRDAAFLGMGNSIDGHGAHATNSFAAVVVEVDRFFSILDEPFVNNIDHFEKRS